MKFKRTLTIILSFSSIILFAQDPFDLNQEEIELNRKEHCVKSYIHFVQKVNEDGTLLKKVYRSKSEFNKNGLTLDSELEMDGRVVRNTYEYDEFGNTTKSEIFINGELTSKSKIDYDNKGEAYKVRSNYQFGRLINTEKQKVEVNKLEIDKDKLSKSDIKYDSLAYTYYKKRDLKSGVLVNNTYKLDSEGRIIEWVSVDNNTYEKSYKKYTYRENDYIEEEIFYYYDGSIDNKFITTYNNKNLEIESKWYSRNGELKQISTYEYEYCDEND